MKNNSELRSCPFCGGKPRIKELPITRDFVITCDFGCCEQINVFMKSNDAIQLWNTRTLPELNEERLLRFLETEELECAGIGGSHRIKAWIVVKASNLAKSIIQAYQEGKLFKEEK